MTDYDRCPKCKKFAWLSTHRCPAQWQVWNEDRNEEDDPALVYATDAEHAAAKYAEEYDSDDHWMLEGNGRTLTVKVRAKDEDPWQEFECHAEADVYYYASAIISKPVSP